MQCSIGQMGDIHYDFTKDFDVDCSETTEVDIDYAVIKDYLDSNRGKSLIDFGHELVAAVQERLNYEI